LTGMNVPLSAIALSTRASIGAGLSMGFGMGRLEATYAWPIRYGPRDARRALQFGFGLNIG
jgi:outer membrane protein assembly factor BamA